MLCQEATGQMHYSPDLLLHAWLNEHRHEMTNLLYHMQILQHLTENEPVQTTDV